MRSESVTMASLREPCMLAESSSLGDGEVPLPVCVGAGGADDNGLVLVVVVVVVVVVDVVLVSIVANRVNRSEILFN